LLCIVLRYRREFISLSQQESPIQPRRYDGEPTELAEPKKLRGTDALDAGLDERTATNRRFDVIATTQASKGAS
jgi:hypothetical protein